MIHYRLWYYSNGSEAYHMPCYEVAFKAHPPEDWEVCIHRGENPGEDGPICAICGEPIKPESEGNVIYD